ncbi:DUF6438 domain-containing protein [Empedobacter brevis]|uniref:DUF6438 domain-containing protein n=1 Tax=Empedobacter brevis TaxID=247 RepID=UPI00289FDC74|nr:DUF6438 domain-containing protein [Empedobacter brevis]
MRHFYILLFLYFLSSCQEKPKADELLLKQIQGNWSSNTAIFNSITYLFENDSVYYSEGFYDGYYKTNRDRNFKTFIPTKFKGNAVKFGLKDSIIHYFDSTNIPKPSFKILSVNKDEMVIKYQDDYLIDTLSRYNNKIINQLDFDQIIYTSSGCYGTCPIINVSINKDGSMIYAAEEFIGIKGVFKGKMTKKFHTFFLQKVNEANLLSLKNNYEEHATDCNEDILLIIKNNKIIKSIRSYCHPVSLQFNSLANVISKSGLIMENRIKYHETEYLPVLFILENKENTLDKARTFLWWTELMKHPTNKVETKNKPISYTNKGYYYYFGNQFEEINPCNLNSVKGNGQEFELIFENNKPKYYDLGYNFFKRYLN